MDKQVWLLATNGEWQMTQDPLAAHRHLEDWNAQAKAAGYVLWASFPQQDVTPVALEIYRGMETGRGPLFLVNVTTLSFYETVCAESVPALMELLARWTPVVQGAAVGQLMGRLEDQEVVRFAAQRLSGP